MTVHRLLPVPAALIVFLSSGGAVFSKGLSVSSLKGKSGTAYRFYARNNLSIGWQVQRPDKKNKRIKLCIPAAFTTTTDTVVGIYAVRGKVSNRRAISEPIGGSILIVDGNFSIFPTKKGKVFTASFIESIKKRKATLFQQFQIVTNGVPARFKDKKKYQMRAIVRFRDQRDGVIESDRSDVTFKTFNTDLAGLGVKNALYTDMGAWDEGWYRDPKTSRIVTIGNDRSKTDKQSNWVIFSEPVRKKKPGKQAGRYREEGPL